MRILLTIAALLFAVSAYAQGTGPMRPEQNIPFSGNNSFTGYSATPTCTLSTTTGSIAVVAAKPCASSSAEGVAWNLVGPLTGNATIGFPSSLVDGLSIGFMINHGTGGYSAGFAPGYLFPSAAISNGQPNLTNTADAVDLVVCQSVNAPLPGTTTPSVLSMWCGSPPLQMTSLASWTLVGHASAQSTSNAQTSGINTNASPGPATLILVSLAHDTSGTSSVSDSGSNTWTLAITEVRGGVTIDLYYDYSPSTSTNHTFTCSGTSNFCTIAVQAWVRPPGGTAALDQSSGANTFTATSLSPGSITPLFPSELVVTEGVFENPITGITISPIAPAAGGFTITDNVPGISGTAEGGAMAYLVQSLAAASNPTWSWTSTTSVAVSQASFR